MNSEQLVALAKEIEGYKKTKKYAECVEKMTFYAREEKDVITKVILLTAKASCNLQLGNLSAAKATLSEIDSNSLTPAESIYVNLVLVTLLQEEGKLIEAEAILSDNLAGREIYSDEHSEALYEMLARKGFILADMNRFDAALKFLDQSLAVLTNGNLHDNIFIYRGYCLQALGRLHEAETSLKKILNEGSGDLAADAFYRLGAVYLQKHDSSGAIAAFNNAERSVPHGRTALADIFMALSEAYRENGDIELAEQYLERARIESTIQ